MSDGSTNAESVSSARLAAAERERDEARAEVARLRDVVVAAGEAIDSEDPVSALAARLRLAAAVSDDAGLRDAAYRSVAAKGR